MSSIKWMGLALLLLAAPVASAEDAGGKPAVVQSIGFNYASPRSKLEIVFDKEITFEKSVSEADKLVIIDVPNAKIYGKWARRIDTSQHKSNIVMISPYQSENRVRVTLLLRDNGGVEISQDGKKIVAQIDNKQPVEKEAEAPKALTDPEKSTPAPDAAKEETPAAASTPPSAVTPVADTAPPADAGAAAGGAVGDSIDQFMKSQDSHQYVGKHIFLQTTADTTLADIFRLISEASEFNIVIASEIADTKAVLNLTDVPWDEALDIILHSYKLGVERQGNVLRVATLASLSSERDAEIAARKSLEQAEPLVVKIIPISYAKVDDMLVIIKDFMTKDIAVSAQPQAFVPPGQPPAASSTGLRGSIQIDKRNNALVIRDTPKTIETIRRIIEKLDTQTPQILIEGKFVAVSENNSSQVSGRLFLDSREFDSTQNAFTTFKPSNNNFGAGFNGDTAQPFSVAGGAGGAVFGFAPKAALLPGISEIGAFLQLLESQSVARVISSPRVVAQNKETASISQGSTIIPVNGANGGQSIKLQLSLIVQPQVANDGSVLMKISFNQDTLGPADQTGNITTNNKFIDTSVIVDSGGTIVIGGVYTSNSTNSESGIPILRNLPIIGPLFGNKSKTDAKDELFIFITPRVLNDKEAGIKG